MKVGAENRKVLITACVLMAVALFLFIRMLRGWTSVSASVPPPKVQATSDLERALAPYPRGVTVRSSQRKGTTTAQPTLDPRLRVALLAQSEEVKYEGTGRNIFDRESAPPMPNPIAPVRPIVPQPTIPPVYTPPPPPPIPLKFYGFANAPGEPKRAFLLGGADDVFLAKEGDVVNRRYRIVRINPNSIEIEDMLTNSRQTLQLLER